MPRHTTSDTRRRQRGVYALEWAIIFPVFFMLLYGIISYGLTMLVRESMQHAAEEGARAALRNPVGIASPNWSHRYTAALSAMQRNMDWLPTVIRPNSANVKFTVCPLSAAESATCTQDTPLNPAQACDDRVPCLVLVSYTIANYQEHAIAPGIPGLGLVLPLTLSASASLLIDRRML